MAEYSRSRRRSLEDWQRILEGEPVPQPAGGEWNLVDNFVDKWVDALPGQAHTERVKED